MEIKLAKDKSIGDNYPSYILVDVGANHNGNLETAKRLIVEAARMGADGIKFQTYTAEKMYSKFTPIFSRDPEEPFSLIKKHQHPREWLPILNKIAIENNIQFTSSPFDFEAADLLEELNVPFYKIASPELVDLELINYIAEKGKPIIISTGMSYLADIEDAVYEIMKCDNNNIVILHCTSLYPTPVEMVNLKAMKTLRKAFNHIIGFSDHTLDIHISLAAVALGAHIIEKHYTLNRNQIGPDHKFAIEPLELKNLVKKTREIEAAMGDGIKKPQELELGENYQKARRSIIALKDIPKGTILTRDMLIVKRPGYGIKPKFMNLVVGKESKVDIKEDQWILWNMI